MKGYWKYALLTFVIFAVSWGVIIADLGAGIGEGLREKANGD